MASIRVLPPTKRTPHRRYQVLYRALEGKQTSGGIYDDDLKAEERRLEIEKRLRRGDPIDADRTPFGAWVERWWPSYSVGRARLANVEKCLEAHLLPRFGDIALGDITATVANEWIVSLRQRGLEESTIKTYLSIFNMILNAAVDAELLDRNPLQRRSGAGRERTIRLKPTRYRKVWLTHVQATSLLNEAPNICVRAMLLIALCCGLRYGEITALRPRHLIAKPFDDRAVSGPARLVVVEAVSDPRSGGIELKDPKSQAGERTIALDQLTYDALCAYLETEPRKRNELLFPSPGGSGGRKHGDGSFWRNNNFNRNVWQPLLDRAKLDALWPEYNGLHFNDLRHTHATWLIADGKPINAVAERLGHADAVVTMRVYAHVMKMVDRGELTADDLAGGTEVTSAAGKAE